MKNLLALVILYGTAIAASIIAMGLLWYLSAHLHDSPGDHIFSGEAIYLRDPIDMVQRAFDSHEIGERRSLTMIGILLLLMNPPMRVALAAAGFAFEKESLYTLISTIVFLVLGVSFFW